ncbi:MAG: tRNA (adenosine(37)-N6)-threonylcarbamoyltransferase complex dimerization subunit type 1 TsaB [Chlamydiales bacterium]
MTLLIIDTSSAKSIVVFAQGNRVRLCKRLPVGWQSSRYLSSLIEEGFKELDMTPSHLQAVALGVGPGSFTGIRVGAAVAKGICFARSIPLLGLCSLSGFISPDEGKFASVIDARIGGAYVLIQERKKKIITPLTNPMLLTKKDLNRTLSQVQWVVGPCLTPLSLPNSIESYPDPHHLAKMASDKWAREGGVKDLELVYLRRTIS